MLRVVSGDKGGAMNDGGAPGGFAPVPRLWSKETAAAVAKDSELYIPGPGRESFASQSEYFADMRRRYDRRHEWWNEGGPAMASVSQAKIPTRHGQVPVRIYRPSRCGEAVIFYMHGGGWCVGSSDSHDRLLRELAAACESTVVSIEYTLAQEAKYPRPFEECADVVGYMLSDNSARFSVAALAGDSCGATLALGVYCLLREAGPESLVRRVRSLHLYYGAFGLRDSYSARMYGGWWDGMSLADQEKYRGFFVRDAADLRAPYLDLLGQQEFSADFPPCYIAAAEFDPLLDDSRLLAAALADAHAPHRLRIFPGTIHAFMQRLRLVGAARDAVRESAEWFQRYL